MSIDLPKGASAQPVRPPPSTFLTIALRLLSPRTWAGLWKFCTDGADGPDPVPALLSALLPALAIGIASSACGRGAAADDAAYLRRLAPLCLASPLTVGSALEATPALATAASRASFLVENRKVPTDDALEALSRGASEGRIVRRGRYDLYLPPPSSPRGDARLRGMILIPGMLIPAESYAAVASRLSDRGVVVAVLSLEPWRIARPGMGAGATDVARVMRDASRDAGRWLRRLDRGDERGERDATASSGAGAGVEWSLGGHSMGGYAALSLASEEGGGAAPEMPDRVVVWAAGKIDELVPDLSRSRCRVLTIQGSSDAYCTFTPEQRDRFQSKMPWGSVHRVIEGGNHDGFASYPSVPEFDGLRLIPRERQHEVVCRETAKFLLERI